MAVEGFIMMAMDEGDVDEDKIPDEDQIPDEREKHSEEEQQPGTDILLLCCPAMAENAPSSFFADSAMRTAERS